MIFAFFSQIFPSVSIRDESRRNSSTMAPLRESSASFIIATASLNHSAIFVRCPAIPDPRRMRASLSHSAFFTCIIFSASHSLSAASLSFSDSITLFIAVITLGSSLISRTCIESILCPKVPSRSLSRSHMASQISSRFSNTFL